MDDIEILQRLEENCGENDNLKIFLKELLHKEFEEQFTWKNEYDVLIEKYSER